MAGFRVGLGDKARKTSGGDSLVPAAPLRQVPDRPIQAEAKAAFGSLPQAELLREQSPALEFLKDEDGHLVYYNNAFANVFAEPGQ